MQESSERLTARAPKSYAWSAGETAAQGLQVQSAMPTRHVM